MNIIPEVILAVFYWFRHLSSKRVLAIGPVLMKIGIFGALFSLSRVALQLRARLNDLREFYDPDTVDLMNWISTHTNPDAIFTGSMQLMAGVKLCTGRAIANHPHYEDARLREKTRRWPDLWLAKPELVKTRTISDSYHLDEETWSALQQPNQAAVRLCSELTQLSAHHSENYPTLQQRRLSRLFTLVYENPTFYIFKVNFVA
ncbi:hypothetical protein T265_02529 [Opisthorchis viverrini]|uniref:Uncharacterized protein n=1 Tax=Opisthorchis viverrini TaxID=6198 RepID=A0A074ZVT5_OPIVI|nr:hypothetical protein T265_02529 [Opisthorchis viverrini]KER31211.1 hypothetical protein T265_02529 [Opisthorchis viverrini]